MEAVLTAEHIHAASATGEVDHLLPGDLARTDADTLTLDAVIAAQQQVAGMGQRRLQRLLDEAHLHRQLFKAA